MENPETTLARRFQDIDGPQSRRASLTHLVKALSPWERRHLRDQLGDRDGLANFEKAPLDLVHLLLPYLFLTDALACTRVSRRCRASWGHESVVAALSARFFPGLSRPLTFDLFLKTCRKYFLRRAGRYTRMFVVRLPRLASVPSNPGWTPHNPPDDPQSDWYREYKVQFTADPRVHADGSYPAPWPDMPTCGFGCYGGGNVVWLAGPNFVVDNLYTRTRRVVSFNRNRSVLEAPEAPALPQYSNSGASKSLVVFHSPQEMRLLIYHLEADSLTRFNLPSSVGTMAVRGTRIFLIMTGWQVCVLEHDGSRVHTKFHFRANEGIQEEFSGLGFTQTTAWPQIYVHPHVEDRFFVAMCSGAQYLPRAAVAGTARGHEPPRQPVQYFVVREYDGAKHVATYLHDVLKREVDEMAHVLNRDPQQVRVHLMRDLDLVARPVGLQDDAPALDDFGLFSVRQFWLRASASDDTYVTGLPPWHGSKEANYALHMTFNVITKKFGLERYFSPVAERYGKMLPPWNQQTVVPTVWVSGVVQLRRFDAVYADNARTDVLTRRELRGERVAVTMAQMGGLSLYTGSACWLHQDSDFTVLFVEGLNQYAVWSFVE